MFVPVSHRTPSNAFSSVRFAPLITPEILPSEPFHTPIRESAAKVTGPATTPLLPVRRIAPRFPEPSNHPFPAMERALVRVTFSKDTEPPCWIVTRLALPNACPLVSQVRELVIRTVPLKLVLARLNPKSPTPEPPVPSKTKSPDPETVLPKGIQPPAAV